MKMQDVRFGIEIETVGQTRLNVGRAIQRVVGGTVNEADSGGTHNGVRVTDDAGRLWDVVSDASLSSVPSPLRAEVVSPILGYQDIPLLQQVVRAVRQCGARTSDPNCGIHIHVSHPDVTPMALANLCKIVYKQQAIVFKALGVNDYRLDHYCKPIDPEFIRRIQRRLPHTFEQLNRQWYGRLVTLPTRYDQSRYHIINLNGYFLRGAVEIRAYAGSLHAGKVKAAVLFSMALLAKAINCRGASATRRTYDSSSAKYDFRVFLVSSLGMIGDEFKSTRMHLLANLTGNSAWKHGRPTLKAKNAASENTNTMEVCCGAS